MAEEGVYYVCRDLISDGSRLICSDWAMKFEEDQIKTGFFADLSLLSYNDVLTLLSLVAMLFASAWLWRLLSKQALR